MDKAEQNQVNGSTTPHSVDQNTPTVSVPERPETTPEAAPVASSLAEATALHVDAMRLNSAHAVYSADLDSDDDYEEVVEEYATTDEPDGTHREERRITRTTHHPRGKQGGQKAGTPGTPDGAAEISSEVIDAGEPETHTTTIRTVTRTVTDPPRRAPRTRFFRRLSKYRGEKNLAAWEKRTSRPMFVASLLYLLAFAAPIMSTRIREPYDAHLNFLQLILWALFAADYCIRLYLAPRRLYFITHNLMNLAIVLLPAWRIVSFLAMIHLTTNRQYKRLSELAVKLFGYTAIFIIMFALAIYSVESSAPGAMIRDLPTAYWWTFTTLATVGYGDVYPVTGIGRVIAVVVMLYGVGLVAVATGALASWIIEKIGGMEEHEYPATKADVDDLRLEIAELRALLARQYARREGLAGPTQEATGRDGTRLMPEATDTPGTGRAGSWLEEQAEGNRQEVAGWASPSAEAGRGTGSEVAVREEAPEQEPVALLEETRQTFTIIREKFSFRSRK